MKRRIFNALALVSAVLCVAAVATHFRALVVCIGCAIVVLPMWVLIRSTWRLRGICQPRTPAGFCSRCGYDLRATLERCPECGTVPAKQSVAKIA